MAKATNTKHIGSAFDLVGKSWERVKANWKVFAVVNILTILGAISSSLGIFNNEETDMKTESVSSFSGLGSHQIAAIVGAGLAVLLVFIVISIFLGVMSASLEVKAAAGKKPSLGELFSDGKKYFFRFIGLYVLLGLIIGFGFVLLIIPGIIALGRLIMAPYHLVDKDLKVTEAIRQSSAQAKGRLGKVYGAIGVMFLISVVGGVIGVVPFVGPLAGAVVTIGFSLVLALRYQQLKSA